MPASTMVCAQCKGDCCKKFGIFVTAHDAARIALNLCLEPTYFLNYYEPTIESGFPAFKINGKEFILGLDSKHSGLSGCVFLLDIGASRRCGIHKHRPLACRTYPFALKDGRLDFVEELLCPKQWWPEGKEREEYIEHLNQFERELEEYRNLVEIWNRNHGERGGFMEFLSFIVKGVEK